MSSPPESAEASAPAAAGPRGVQVKIVCSHCSTVVTRHSRKGYTVRCPKCGTVNAGPALIAEQAKPNDQGARRRMRRREARAERAADEPGTSPSAPAPVRRKRSSAQTSGAPTPTAAPAAGDTPSQGAPAPARRGLLDRLIWGEDE